MYLYGCEREQNSVFIGYHDHIVLSRAPDRHGDPYRGCILSRCALLLFLLAVRLRLFAIHVEDDPVIM